MGGGGRADFVKNLRNSLFSIDTRFSAGSISVDSTFNKAEKYIFKVNKYEA
jgi:hypothetical protein